MDGRRRRDDGRDGGRRTPCGERGPQRQRGSSRPPSRSDEQRAKRKPASEDASQDLCWGRAPVLSLLEEMPARCLKVSISSTMQRAMFAKITELCAQNGIKYTIAEPKHLDSMTSGENHQGVAAVIAASDMISLDDAVRMLPDGPAPALAVLFDRVQDPQNLGAMIRTAEAAGATFAALPVRRGALPTGTVVKTSAGASLRVPLATIGSPANAIREMQEHGLWCVGLEADGERTIYEAELPPRALIVVGSEGRGLAQTTRRACDEILRIPITGGVGSLNASVALGAALFEWVRRNGADLPADR